MNIKDIEEGKLYTITEVAEMLGCNRATLYNWIKSGKLTFTQVGGRRKFTREQLAAFLEEKTKE